MRLQVILSDSEAKALARLSYAEMRDPREQIRFIVRSELERRGLLPANPPTTPVGGDEPREVQP